jgi:hypothetical protein
MSPFRTGDLTTVQWLAVLGLGLLAIWLVFGDGVERILGWVSQVRSGIRVR